MIRYRELPKELTYRNRSPRRNPRLPRTATAKPSLVNCNHLATTDTKVPEETLDERLKRKQEIVRRRVSQTRLCNELLASLRIVASRNMQEALKGREEWKRKSGSKWSPARDIRRLEPCQTEFIGQKPTCCHSRAIAVPIGCNHRLCARCNAGRLEKYREKARSLLKAMVYPTFLTLTVPNTGKLTPETYREIRAFWKVLCRTHKSLLEGGVYSIETTYNRRDGTWHPHIHVIFDSPCPTRGLKRKVFLTMKRSLEFSWLRITSPEAKRLYGRNEYGRWLADGEKHSSDLDWKLWKQGYPEFHYLGREERKRLRNEFNQQWRSEHPEETAWNQQYRRVIDIRPVVENPRLGERSLAGAVYELLKYISKTNRFLDVPDAVEGYLRAVRGVRMIQSFGKLYRFKFEDDPEPHLRCECGQNNFQNIGFFSMYDTEMDENGHWFVKQSCEHKGRSSNRLLHERHRCRGFPTSERE